MSKTKKEEKTTLEHINSICDSLSEILCSVGIVESAVVTTRLGIVSFAGQKAIEEVIPSLMAGSKIFIALECGSIVLRIVPNITTKVSKIFNTNEEKKEKKPEVNLA